MNKTIETAFEFMDRTRGLNNDNRDSLIERILLTKKDIAGETPKDSEDLFKKMQESTLATMPPYNGTVESFYSLYNLVNSLNDEELLELGKMIWEFENGTAVNPELAKILFSKIKSNDLVYLPEGEKFVSVLYKVAAENPDSNFVVGVKIPWMKNLFKQVFDPFKNVEVIDWRGYDELDGRNFDQIISIPDFGIRVADPELKKIGKDVETIALKQLPDLLSQDGELNIIVPAAKGFSTADQRTRQFVNDNYSVTEIASLPEGTFKNTGVKTLMIRLKNGPTDETEIVAYKKVGDGRTKRNEDIRLEVESEGKITDKEFEDFKEWNPQNFFASKDPDIQDYLNSPINKEKLKDVVEGIFRGKSIRSKDENGNIGVIEISNLVDGKIDLANVSKIDSEERKVSPYLLQDGDFLIAARGAGSLKTGIFREQKIPFVASSNFVIIRPDKQKLNGEYLNLFLETPAGEKLLKNLMRGSGVLMNINAKDLDELLIPVPVIEEQNRAADEFNSSRKKFEETVRRASQEFQLAKEKAFRDIY